MHRGWIPWVLGPLRDNVWTSLVFISIRNLWASGYYPTKFWVFCSFKLNNWVNFFGPKHLIWHWSKCVTAFSLCILCCSFGEKKKIITYVVYSVCNVCNPLYYPRFGSPMGNRPQMNKGPVRTYAPCLMPHTSCLQNSSESWLTIDEFLHDGQWKDLLWLVFLTFLVETLEVAVTETSDFVPDHSIRWSSFVIIAPFHIHH